MKFEDVYNIFFSPGKVVEIRALGEELYQWLEECNEKLNKG